MFDKKRPCTRCRSSIKADFDFCPHCGCDMRNPEKDLREFGLLGKNEFSNAPVVGGGSMGFGISDKILASLIQQVFKALESQNGQQGQPGELQAIPNGFQLNIGVGPQKQPARQKIRKVTEDQLKRMAGAPRVEAKTEIRRLSDRVVYELKAPDVEVAEDVFVSKVESGYEVKAIGKKKVYVNSLQVDLPLKDCRLEKNKGVTLEFGAQ